LKENDEFGTGNVETLTLLSETRILISPPDHCGPNTIVIPTELCSSSRSMGCSSSSNTDSQKSENTIRGPFARYNTVNRNKEIASLQSFEDDLEQLSYFDFTANDEEPPDFIYNFLPDHADPILSTDDCRTIAIVIPTESRHSVLRNEGSSTSETDPKRPILATTQKAIRASTPPRDDDANNFTAPDPVPFCSLTPHKRNGLNQVFMYFLYLVMLIL